MLFPTAISFCPFPRRTVRLLAAAACALFPLDRAPAQDLGTDPVRDWGERIHRGCGAGGPGFADCLAGLLSDAAGDHAMGLAARGGRSAFGGGFRLHGRLGFAPSDGLTGGLDAVIPLGFAEGDGTPDARRGRTALFVQPGVTTYRDGDGARRNDLSLGMGWRVPVGEADVTGLSVLFQESAERGHGRLALGADYAGRWGTGHVTRYVPVTGWRPGRPGFEERARGGAELGARLTVTSTLSATAAVGRWETADGHDRTARLGADWRPHPYMSLAVGHGTEDFVGSGASGGGTGVSVAFRVPLGNDARNRSRPRWEGLGVAGNAGASPDPYAPVTVAGRIATVERGIGSAAPDAGAGPDGVSVAFLQDAAGTGSRVGVRVSVPEPADADLRLSVRLVPGGGPDPAVPGEDFADGAHEVTVARGRRSADVWILLLHNPDLRTDRSLSVEVTRIPTAGWGRDG